ncbi:CFI-box-CTERM domain-containing protein [Jejuia pallidilutea]|uniref:Uncharacterized protein n=1 Tax=Jejuia pallidilutea TaxID=504487 RepID=A0A090W2T9_9FLAO|nr:CFI-box-CTERM domain-containing protein [Jejuia pallidilutea]GAL66739.1 hypothetical protein JCM19301_1283 [Jejuia pallidilutea]GAL70478.1 hypothetical protein JCM19302_3600 [Jejuia pallidilutea]GAL90540.1 hypothetical protein JCM19538_305 [Jejuia pallidilutea]
MYVTKRSYRYLIAKSEKKELPSKLTGYNYKHGDFVNYDNPKCDNLYSDRYVELFLTDDNEKYLELYLAVSNQYPGYDFAFYKNYIKSIDDLISLKQLFESMPKKTKIIDPNKNQENKGVYEKDGIHFRPVIHRPYMVVNDSKTKIEFLQKLQERDQRFDEIDRKNKTGKYAPKKEGCYIATMVYQDYNHPKVITLRVFRDEILEKYHIGKWFVSKYYKYSPSFVKKFQNSFWAKPIKVFVETIVFILERTSCKKI